MALGHTTAGIGIAACVISGPHTYLTWLMAAAVGNGMTGSGLYAFAQTLAGPRATGLQNGFANFAGVIAPALTGFLVNRAGNFLAAFAITAAVPVVGSLGWVLAVRQLERVIWDTKPRKSARVANPTRT